MFPFSIVIPPENVCLYYKHIEMPVSKVWGQSKNLLNFMTGAVDDHIARAYAPHFQTGW